jgi:hypothetical protein
LEESILRFLDGLTKEEESGFLLMEYDWESRDSLDLLAKFKLYRII